MSERVNFAIVGCGEISLHTSESVLASRRARVVHCMDVRRDLAADLAARHGARFTDRLEDVLADDEVRAVIVPTPHFQHAPLSIRAARAGKHVLVEKPLACTLAEADAMIAAADEAGVRLGVFHPQRLAFGYAEARRLVRAGALGRIVAYKIHAMSHKPPHYWHGGYTGRVPDDWRIHLETSGGGYLLMNLIHNLDSMVSILDPAPQRIYAEYATLSTPVEVEDFVSFVMRLDGGAIVSLDGSSAAVGAESFGDRVYGQRGQVAVNRSCRVFLHEPWEGLPAGQWVELSPPEGAPNARTAYLDAFAEAILTGGEVPVSGREGRRALEIARGAYLSMQRGGPVSFPVSE